jgi:hypothetical protein
MEISGPIISSISFPNYTTCGSLVSVHSCPLLTSLTIYCTSQSGRSLGVYDMAGLTSLSLPNLVNPWGWNMVNNPALTQISAPNWTGALGAYTYTWNGGGLQANGTGGKLGVNDLLVLMNNATVGYHAATVNLAGGTNAVPTGAGATAKTALALKVLSLTTNI